MKYSAEKLFANGLDAQDPLSEYRSQFSIPVKNGKQVVYFMGNSLGLQPKNAKKYINFIKNYCGVKMSSISTSPKREDTILLENPFK